MNETRVKVMPVTDLLEYKIRSGQISNEGGHKIFGIAIMNILDLDLSEADTIAKVERLV